MVALFLRDHSNEPCSSVRSFQVIFFGVLFLVVLVLSIICGLCCVVASRRVVRPRRRPEGDDQRSSAIATNGVKSQV